MKSMAGLFAISLLLSGFLTPLFRRLYIQWGKLDEPGGRKTHTSAVPRSGGIGIMLAYLGSLILLLLLPSTGSAVIGRYAEFLLKLLPAISVVFLTGVADDWIDLKPRYKLAGQFAAAVMAYWAGIRLWDAPPGWEWLAVLATCFWLVLASNAFNLIDGSDGLAGLLCVVSCFGMIVVALAWDYYALALVFTPLLAATIPFLRANWPPATVFLGDAGSLSLGFLVGCGGAALSRRFPDGGGMLAAMLILTVPLMEVVLSSARRMLRGRPIFQADANHIHHELKRQGMDSARVLLRLGIVALVGTTIAVLQIRLSGVERVLVVVPYAILLAHAVASLRYPEFKVLWEALLEGRMRKWLQHQIALLTMEEELRAAKSSEEAWSKIQEHAKMLGLADLNVSLNGLRWNEPVTEQRPEPSWSARVKLPLRGWVNFRVNSNLRRTENPAGDFAAALTRTITAPQLAQYRRGDLPVPDQSPEAVLLDRSA
jgi:UDP-GlcNAc:undecaprenyl-phosphate/decaprenyl-phosphate GlcNAc-1-phosphate transferase